MILANKINESYSTLVCDRGIAQEISEYFSFLVPGYLYMPKFKNKIWDGYARLAKLLPNGNVEFPIGLMHQLEVFCEDREYPLIKNYEDNATEVDIYNLKKFVEDLNVHSGGKKITVRDYQFTGVLNFIKNKRLVLLSPTSSGKSLILYIIIRYLLEKKCKILLLAPSTSLLYQLSSDFADYASETDWDADEHIHKIFSGQDKDSDKPILISTWQSLQSRSMKNRGKTIKAGISESTAKEYFKQFDCVIADEAHGASSTELSNIIDQCINAKYRIGVTGTLNGTKLHSLQLESLFGRVLKVTTTHELMKNKEVADLKIKCLVLKYPKEICKLTNKLKYSEELLFLLTNKERNRLIKNLSLALKGNTLLLYQYIDKHGKILYDLIKNSKLAENKVIYFIHGDIKAEEREIIRKSMETQDNVILIGSSGTVSTGTNIKNLHNIIFASPAKARIKTLQSIGRILRLHESKNVVVVYDISDDLRIGKHINFTLHHYKERMKIYNEEKFVVKTHKIDMKDTTI